MGRKSDFWDDTDLLFLGDVFFAALLGDFLGVLFADLFSVLLDFLFLGLVGVLFTGIFFLTRADSSMYAFIRLTVSSSVIALPPTTLLIFLLFLFRVFFAAIPPCCTKTKNSSKGSLDLCECVLFSFSFSV